MTQTPVPASLSVKRRVLLDRKLTRVLAGGFLGLYLALIVSMRGQWKAVVVVALLFPLQAIINIRLDAWLRQWKKPQVEWVRTFLNAGLSVLLGTECAWPLTVFFIVLLQSLEIAINCSEGGWLRLAAQWLVVGGGAMLGQANPEVMGLFALQALVFFAMQHTHSATIDGILNAEAEHLRELEESTLRYRSLVENTDAVPWEYDVASRKLLFIAPQAAAILGCSPETLGDGEALSDFFHPGDRARLANYFAALDPAAHFPGDSFELRVVRLDGRIVYLHCILNRYDPGQPLRGLSLDVTTRKTLELDLQQAQKLESVGRLASGVAHEINTPVQFVSDSVHFVREAAQTYVDVFEVLKRVQVSVLQGRLDEAARAASEAEALMEAGDLGLLLDRVPRALDRSIEGLERIATIVRSMKEFAHPDGGEASSADLNRAVESTLIIARNEYKYVAEVVTDFGELPLVLCHIGDVNQAVLNIVVNAAHAIGERVKGTDKRGKITVRSQRDGNDVVVSISDDGAGIPHAIQGRIFDPFFTTKEVGKGTGQGLAISRSVIVEKHGGQLTFESQAGEGTTFRIRLPIEGKPAPSLESQPQVGRAA